MPKKKTVKRTVKKRIVKKRTIKRSVKKTVKRTTKKIVKRSVKRIVKKAVLKPVKPIGAVTHYFRKIKVAVVKFKNPIKVGTLINFRGETTDFTQSLDSIQYDHKNLKVAPKGKQVGIKVKKRVRKSDMIYPVKS